MISGDTSHPLFLAIPLYHNPVSAAVAVALPAYSRLAAEVRWWWGGKRCGNSGYGGSGPRDGAVAVTVGAVGMVDLITYYVQ